jgi:hypothetical protein
MCKAGQILKQHSGAVLPAILTLICISGCNSLSLQTQYQSEKNIRGERHLGTLSVAGEDEDSPARLNAYQMKKGYALRGNLERSKGYEHNVVLQKEKDLDWFAGLQWRWEL